MMSKHNNSSNLQSMATMIALYNFEAEDEPEISLKKGDRVEMLDMDVALNGWAYARRCADGSEGYVPVSYLGANTSHSARHKTGTVKSTTNNSRSTSPLPGSKLRYNESRNGFGRNPAFTNNSANNNNNHQNSAQSLQQQQQQQQQQRQQHHHHAQQGTAGAVPPAASTAGGGGNSSKSKGGGGGSGSGADGKLLVCSFHRDFIPEISDLYKYFGEFGKISNKLEIEYDQKKVPLAKIRFASPSSVDKVCDKGNRQQIPSGAQNGAIYIRVYRSMDDYSIHTQRSNGRHSTYNRHQNQQSRRGAAF